MLDNKGNEVTTKKVKKLKKIESISFEQHFDKWYEQYVAEEQEEEQGQEEGKIYLANTIYNIYANATIEERTQALYNLFTDLYIKHTYCYKDYLTVHDIDSIIYESCWHIAELDPSETFNNINHYIFNRVRGNCSNARRKQQAIKRGGKAKFIYLDDSKTHIQIEDTKTEILDKETEIILDEMKGKLTKSEYKYCRLILELPYIPNNVEAAELLKLHESSIRKIKKSLQTKLQLI